MRNVRVCDIQPMNARSLSRGSVVVVFVFRDDGTILVKPWPIHRIPVSDKPLARSFVRRSPRSFVLLLVFFSPRQIVRIVPPPPPLTRDAKIFATTAEILIINVCLYPNLDSIPPPTPVIRQLVWSFELSLLKLKKKKTRRKIYVV